MREPMQDEGDDCFVAATDCVSEAEQRTGHPSADEDPECDRCGHVQTDHPRGGRCGGSVDDEEGGATCCDCQGFQQCPPDAQCEGDDWPSSDITKLTARARVEGWNAAIDECISKVQRSAFEGLKAAFEHAKRAAPDPDPRPTQARSGDRAPALGPPAPETCTHRWTNVTDTPFEQRCIDCCATRNLREGPNPRTTKATVQTSETPQSMAGSPSGPIGVHAGTANAAAPSPGGVPESRGAISYGRRQEVIEQLCKMMGRVWSHLDPNAHNPCDCVCRHTLASYQNSGEALTFMEEAISNALIARERGACTDYPTAPPNPLADRASGQSASFGLEELDDLVHQVRCLVKEYVDMQDGLSTVRIGCLGLELLRAALDRLVLRREMSDPAAFARAVDAWLDGDPRSETARVEGDDWVSSDITKPTAKARTEAIEAVAAALRAKREAAVDWASLHWSPSNDARVHAFNEALDVVATLTGGTDGQ